MENIYSFFGFNEDPFRLTPDPQFFFPSHAHKEALLSLEYVVKGREGFCMVTGEPGTGKTTLISVFQERLRNRAEIAVILTPRLSPDDFLQAVLEEFKITATIQNKNELLKTFREFLIEKFLSDRPVIIIVDEAQNIPDETLEELRLLSNLETAKDKLLQIILIGQPELKLRLQTKQLRQLEQRITEHILLRPLTREETLQYINYRLDKAGRDGLCLSSRVLSPIFRFTRGIPRVINLLVSRIIMAAYVDESIQINQKHAAYAIRYFKSKSSRSTKNIAPSYRYVGTAACLVLVTIIGFVSFFQFYSPVQHAKLQIDDHAVQAGISMMTPQMDSFQLEQITSPNEDADGLLLEALEQEPTKTANAHSAANQHQNIMHQSDLLQKPPLPLEFSQKNPKPQKHHFAVISTYAANVRSAPHKKATSVGHLKRGTQLEITTARKDLRGCTWYNVTNLFEGKGWISEKVITLLPIRQPQVIERIGA
ncbi:MAG: AAA family ATPase [Deltaproteobacteria bacterium]|nr:AAA family ATPase [Deltaproteobacteria bacterium]